MRNIPTEHLRRRKKAETRFRRKAAAALLLALTLLAFILGSLLGQGAQGFRQSFITLPIVFDVAALNLLPGETPLDAPPSAYQKLATTAIKARFPQVTERLAQRQLVALLSTHIGVQLKTMVKQNESILGSTQPLSLPLASTADLYLKGKIDKNIPESDRPLSDAQLGWLDELSAKGEATTSFNTGFFTHGDSRSPERAGFLGAVIGSLLTLACCLAIAFPIGVMTAVYLEEFARPNRIVSLIEVNINNLAAVPSIVFGLLGLAVYINLWHLPRSAPLVGGLTLAMMILPVIIISTRAALSSVPRAIRDAALGLGASPVLVVWHHVLPLAMPGIMTGTILGMARAIGETAPLIMIGMVAFVADIPSGILDSATVMPVQIYLWASSPEAGFAEKTACGILVLLVLMLALNALAIFLRKRFEVRW